MWQILPKSIINKYKKCYTIEQLDVSRLTDKGVSVERILVIMSTLFQLLAI